MRAAKLPKDTEKLPKEAQWQGDKMIPPPGHPSDRVPKIFYGTVPSEVILFDGKPQYTKIPQTQLSYATSTASPVFLCAPKKEYCYLAAGRWFRSNGLEAQWSFASMDLPPDFARIPLSSPASAVLASTPGTEEAKDAVLIAQIPTVMEIDPKTAAAQAKVTYTGTPQFAPIQGTSLQYATNTPDKVIPVGDVYYLCLQGVWFMSANAQGPWTTASSVPQVIYTIPPSSPQARRSAAGPCSISSITEESGYQPTLGRQSASGERLHWAKRGVVRMKSCYQSFCSRGIRRPCTAQVRRIVLTGLSLCSIAVSGALAQTPPSEACSPAATKSLKSDKQLPPNPEPFGGVIKRDARESKPCWPPRVVPPTGAPNVLLIMTDDAGFGVSSTFGGVIPTPALDRIANNGLRYTNFNSTALCSPTRAALITGRNHHSVGFGVISEQATGYPGYNSIIPKDKATIGRMLKENGYATSWFGKDHNTPAFQASQSGPFDQWPVGMGFDYFYGFVGGDANQWQPNLFRNTTEIYPYVGHPGWNLTTAMADDAIEYMKRINAVNPKQPFFIHYVPGGTHAPHHPTPEWIKKISDMHLFDKGWDQLREQIFANQKKLGVIRSDAKLTPWPSDLLKHWDQLTADEKKMFLRQVDVFAAYVAYTDHEIGRVIQEVEDEGKLNNTLIIYIEGDNGTSSEGTLLGTPNEVAMFNQVEVPVEVQLKYFYDVWGSDKTYNHMAVPWAWAFDTPFTWTKQIASHFGGVRQGMAISWPGHIDDPGGIRHQFHHMIDVVPTILEAAQIEPPEYVDGIKQKPIEGVSMAYTFKNANANAPSNHHTQYFEMFGDHALYHDGWIASTKVMRPPWDTGAIIKENPADYPWELYDLTKDWSQCDNVVDKYPEKLKELQDLFWTEAEKYQVLPLDNSVVTRLLTPKPSLSAGRTVFTYSGVVTGTPNGDAPSILNSSYNFKAEVEIPQGGEGMIVTQGGRFGGYGFYLMKGKPVFVWNLVDLKRIRWEGAEVIPPGTHTLEFDFKYEGLGIETLAFGSPVGVGRGGTGVLKVDSKTVATQNMEHTIPFILQWDENFDIGADTGTPVDEEYQVPFAFNGTIDKLTLTIDRPKLSPADIQKLQEAQRNNKVSE